MLKILVNLCYYSRPTMVINALKSLRDVNYDNFEFVFIDDGSPDQCWWWDSKLDSKLRHRYFIDNTPEQKEKQGGSIHGEFMNRAILESDADIVISLCDDDGIHPDYFSHLDDWFRRNPFKNYVYSHVIPFDPTKEPMIEVGRREYWTNHTVSLNPVDRVDSSQVAFRAKCFKEHGVRYPSPQTKNLDSALFKQFFKLYGPCEYGGFVGQYKGCHADQLIWK